MRLAWAGGDRLVERAADPALKTSSVSDLENLAQGCAVHRKE